MPHSCPDSHGGYPVFRDLGLKTALGIENLFHHFLLKVWSRVNQHVGLDVERWREALKNQVKVHRQRLSDGLWKSIERNAKDAPPAAVASALEWTLAALDEDKEIETFAAGVPGFFDSRTVCPRCDLGNPSPYDRKAAD